MKISELQTGQVYSYGNSPTRVHNRVPIIPLVTSHYLQVATDRQRSQGKPFLFRHDRKTFSSGDPERGLLVLMSRTCTPEALEVLRDRAAFYTAQSVPEASITPRRTLILEPPITISWHLLNPAWIREPWEDHLDRLQEINDNAVRHAQAMKEKSQQLTDEATRIRELLRLKGITTVRVDRTTAHQWVPNATLIRLLERI